MTQIINKLASSLLALALVASFVPAAVFAQAEGEDAAPEQLSEITTTNNMDAPVGEPGNDGAPSADAGATSGDTGSSDVSETRSLTDVDLFATDRTTWYVNDNAAAGGDGSLASPLRSIQEAINLSNANDTIYVFSGEYLESAPGSTVSSMGVAYEFGLFFGVDQEGVSIIGLDNEGAQITDADDTDAPVIKTHATNNFGPSGIFVDADNVTIQGVRVIENVGSNNKTIEVVGDNFTLRDSTIDVAGGSVYINDFEGEGVRVNSYSIEDNKFNQGSTLDIASGAGASAASAVSERTITGNAFDGAGATARALISFSGAGGQAWYVYQVGGAVITGNTFKNAEQYVRARGAYAESQFDWSSYFANNTFSTGAAMTSDSSGAIRSYAYGTYTNARRIGGKIGGEVTNAVAGDTISVAAGMYTEELLINKAVSIVGAGSDASGTVITNPAGGNSRIGAVQLAASGTAGAPILLKDLRILPNGKAGISVGEFTQSTGTNVEYVTLENVHVIGTNMNACTEQERGLYVDNTSSLRNLVVTDSAFDNLTYGWYFQKSVSADASTVEFVTVTDSSFTHNSTKGIYAEKLSNVTFTNVTVNENGFSSTADLAGCSYFHPSMAGVDINLKAGAYTAISFVDSTITDNATGAANGAGLAIKARTDGATYGAFPATLTDVSVTGGVISGNKVGIRFGEPTKANAGPTNATVSSVAFSGNLTAGLNNETTSTVVATGNWWGNASGPTIAANVGGTGEVIVENPGLVTYAAWCDNETCTTAPVSTGGNGGGGRSGGSNRSSSNDSNTGTVDGGTTGEGQVLGAETYNFSASLTTGSTGADVTALQAMLIASGDLVIGAPTGYFGEMTRAALAKWQAAHGVTPATGYFGPITMAAIAAMGTLAPVMTAEARAALIKDLLEKVAELQKQLDAMDEDAA